MEYLPTHFPRIYVTTLHSEVSEQSRETYSAIPVSLQVFLVVEDLSFLVFERSASNENFEESYSEGPNVGFSGVVRKSTRTLRREILEKRLCEVDKVGA